MAASLSLAEAVPLSPAAREALSYVRSLDDHRGAPFLLVDKRAARLWLFDGGGRLRDSTAVLLGFAVGDDSIPGIGERPLAQIAPWERTTPAGRFVAEPGINARGEEVIWVDYDAAVSMHRLRANNPVERRRERLASREAEDNRISFGCINVPEEFYVRRLVPLMRQQRPVIYVLPETRPVATLFAR